MGGFFPASLKRLFNVNTGFCHMALSIWPLTTRQLTHPRVKALCGGGGGGLRDREGHKRREQVIVFLYPHLGSDIPSLLPNAIQ